MYVPVPRSEFLDVLQHIHRLEETRTIISIDDRYRHALQKSLIAQVRSQAGTVIKHPTLRTMYRFADAFSLDDVGVHRLYGYRLERYFLYDRMFNNGRTHFVDPHLLPSDLMLSMIPERLVESPAFQRRALLDDLVVKWNDGATSRAVRELRSSQIVYLCVGLEDSASWRHAAGGVLQVELLNASHIPLDPETVYVIQFGNGYRCSRCVRRGERLILLGDETQYTGPREFSYPDEARILGRVMTLFLPASHNDGSVNGDLPTGDNLADLKAPWERTRIADLLVAKHRRFSMRSPSRKLLREKFEDVFGTRISETTERRFRDPVIWQPHAHIAIYLSLRHYTRYRDMLRSFGQLRNHRPGYALREMLRASRWSDLEELEATITPPTPTESWQRMTSMYAEYPGLVLPQIFQERRGRAEVWRVAEDTRSARVPFRMQEGTWTVTKQAVEDGHPRNLLIGAVIPSQAAQRRITTR